MRFGDVFLNEDRLSCHQQALNEVANFKRRVPKKHPVTLGALRDFDHHGKATDGFNGLLHVQDVSYVDRFGNGNSVSGENLGGVEFVSALQDALAGVGGPNAQLLNVAKHGHAVLRDGMTDARNDGIFSKGTAAMQDIDTALIDDEGEFHRVANFDVQILVFWLPRQYGACCRGAGPGSARPVVDPCRGNSRRRFSLHRFP